MCHGDRVRDVVFSVNNLETVMEKTRAHRVKIVKETWNESDD